MSLKHSIIYNNYISVGFLKLYDNKYKMKDYIYKLIRYSFTHVNINQSKLITDKLFTIINNFDSDYNILKLLFNWYIKLKKKDFIGYETSDAEYIKSKVTNINKIITQTHLDIIKNSVLLDIGAGDCTITKAFSDYNNLIPVGIDIKSAIDWGSAGINVCSQINHISYNGNNLKEAYVKNFKNKKVGLIMYNHSLHHFGSFENIYKSLLQSYELLPKGGILFIREHNNKGNDIDINLQHIFLSLRYTIEHYSVWNFEQIWKYFENFIYTYTSHFFSKEFLIKICKKIGFKLINAKKNQKLNYVDYTDISRTYLYSFVK